MKEKKAAFLRWLAFRRYQFCRHIRPVLLVLVLAAGIGFGFLTWVLASAPELSAVSVAPHGYRTSVLDDQGNEILTLAGEESNRVYVTLDQIPEHLQKAFIAIEDERFYQHHGIDLRGIARAAWEDLTSGSLAQGGSTITQQLIKNNVFSGGSGEKTTLDKIERKLQEQYMAIRLERSTSKAWILENYLNTINLGGGAWGVQTAAQRYFGKDVSQLSLPESAVIAAIAQSPSAFNPLKNPERNRERAQLVLRQMEKLGFIDENTYQAALAEDIYAKLHETAGSGEIPIFSYFEDAAVSEVAEDLQTILGYSETDTWQLLYRGGLTIETTQDTALQTICEEEVNRADTDVQASVVIMDSASGAVKAIVGGRGEKTGSLTWNRAISSPRQPGSTVKIVGEYAAALEQGLITLATVYDDAPTAYSSGVEIHNAGGTYSGRTTVRTAIVHSLNTVALQCFQQTGLEAVWDLLQDFGFSHLTEEDRVEALALGGTYGGVTNQEMTAAYAAIANGGEYWEPHYYTRVLSRDGTVLLEKSVEHHRVLSTNTTALLTSAMEDVMDLGTGAGANFSGPALAGKSGTSSELRDTWFVGFSPLWTCGVWTGYDDFSPQPNSSSVKILWRNIMRRAHQGRNAASFDGLAGMEAHTICTKCGKLAVHGLCEEDIQGNMTREEWFVPGTAPTENCDCHIRVVLCKESGQRAGLYCPERETRVYLKEGTPGTSDEKSVAPQTSCETHLHWWNYFGIGDDGETEEDPAISETPEDPEAPFTPRPSGEPLWPSFFDWRGWLPGNRR